MSVDQRYLRFPHVEPGMAIGLFGGSFDPPHAGHWLVAETALRRLKLDRVWWTITPQNPLKTQRLSGDLSRRIGLSEALVNHPLVEITAFEAAHDLKYSADTIALLLQRFPRARFVWIMGADNLKNFHRWERWRWIAETIPIAIVDRPGSTLSQLSSVMAKFYAHARIDEQDAALLARIEPPAWTFLHGPRSSISSTSLRLQGAKGEG